MEKFIKNFYSTSVGIKISFVYLYNRQSENINNPSLLYLAVSIEEGLFFIIMKEKFFEYLEFLFYLLGGLGFWFIVIHFLHKYW